MYTLSKEAFGAYQLYTITHSKHEQSMSFIPEHAGCLISLVIEGQEVIDGFQVPEDVASNSWGKSGFLYPFPNRLEDGKYCWKGGEYQFPINELERNNALHGFGMTRPLAVVETKLTANEALIRMESKYAGELPYYPWPFTVTMTYRLQPPNQLEVTFSVRNDGEATLPIGLGWHPYFQLDERASDCRLQLPVVEHVKVDERMIPRGKRVPYTTFTSEQTVGDTSLDTCFALAEVPGRISVQLSGSRGRLHYWQETGPDKFNFLQVFKPPYGSSIALEPMTCSVNAFNNGDGLKELEPGELLSAKVGVELMR